MSSRHVEEGAGREYVDPRDYSCDYCARTVYSGSLRQVTFGRSISSLCPTCYERQQDEYERMTEPEPPPRDPADYEEVADALADYLVASAFLEAVKEAS